MDPAHGRPASPSSPAATPSGKAGWLHTPVHDVALAFAWAPFALAAHLGTGNPDSLRWVVSATLLFSLAHQPLTLWLAYGDASQRRAHPTLFSLAPLAAAAAVAAGASWRPELVALVAGVWNVAHTIRQRYGVSRLYGRISGIDCAGDNRLLWSWLVVSVLFALAATDVGGAARAVGLGARNTAAIDGLASLRAATVILLPLGAAVAVASTVRAIRDERHRSVRSGPRLVYLGSTALLLAVLAVEPVTGFVAYVGGHAAEYLLMVRWRIARAAERFASGDLVGSLARRIGSVGTMGAYVAVVVVFIVVLRAPATGDVASTVVLTVGALHVLYDGVIWRSPRPPVGATVAIASAPR